MELWSPPHDRPHLFEWWRPLLLASQQARRRRLPWPIHLDEFRLAGRVLREDRPDVWIYEHHANGGSLCIDATGTTYRFIPTPAAKGVGQFRPCDIRTAVWRAGLPEVGVLDSGNFSSLHPGYLVVFSGIYNSEREARANLDTAKASYPQAYARQITQ